MFDSIGGGTRAIQRGLTDSCKLKFGFHDSLVHRKHDSGVVSHPGNAFLPNLRYGLIAPDGSGTDFLAVTRTLACRLHRSSFFDHHAPWNMSRFAKGAREKVR